MMSMPIPICEVCKKEMTFSKDADWDAGYWYCFGDHVESGVDLPHAIMHENAQAAYIATLEAENAALKAQIAALEEKVDDLEGWLDDPSGYWGGGGRTS